MDIQRLKKRLLKEELRRRKRSSKKRRILLLSAIIGLLFLFGGLYLYVTNLDKLLAEDFHRAEAALEEGDYDESTRLFREIYERRPGFELAPQALFQSAEVLNLYLRRYHEALLAYLLVVKDYPESDVAARAQAQVAQIYKDRLRDYGRAIVAYQRLLDDGGPEADRLQYEVADAYFRLENFEQARIEFESLAKNHPRSDLLPEVRYRIAVTASLEEKEREAEESFRMVIENWPESPYAVEARFGLATLLEEREELRESLKILESLQGVYPNQEALSTKIDQVRERIRKKKKAI